MMTSEKIKRSKAKVELAQELYNNWMNNYYKTEIDENGVETKSRWGWYDNDDTLEYREALLLKMIDEMLK